MVNSLRELGVCEDYLAKSPFGKLGFLKKILKEMFLDIYSLKAPELV